MHSLKCQSQIALCSVISDDSGRLDKEERRQHLHASRQWVGPVNTGSEWFYTQWSVQQSPSCGVSISGPTQLSQINAPMQAARVPNPRAAVGLLLNPPPPHPSKFPLSQFCCPLKAITASKCRFRTDVEKNSRWHTRAALERFCGHWLVRLIFIFIS